MQYFKPRAAHQFVGDCMPFFHDGTFHLYYLLDQEHHRARNGFGAHQWAHASSTDLLQWQHHPLAIPVGGEGEYDYLSICTGSVFFHDGVFYGFYATRRVDENGVRSEHLCRATSTDGIHFTKDPANPLASPGGWYDSSNFRDPTVFRDERTGTFHMLVTACVQAPKVEGQAGCLAQLVSTDLDEWELRPPFVADLPGRPGFGVAPECCDYFHWNGWYYLVFTDPPHATTYRMSREPLGPWIVPTDDAFDTPMAKVFKTAAFTGGRRLAAAFIVSLADNKDDGAWEYAGNAVFRELVQHEDGTLGMKWPAEMIPRAAPALPLSYDGDQARPATKSGPIELHRHVRGSIAFGGVPENARITLDIAPGVAASYFGLRLRGSAGTTQGYELLFAPREKTVRIFAPDKPRTLANRAITNVTGLDRRFSVDILLYDDIIDICVDNRRCLCTRLPELRGDVLTLFSETGDVAFDRIEVCPLIMGAPDDKA